VSTPFERDPVGDLVRRVRPERPDGRPSDGFLVPNSDPSADAMLVRITATIRRRRRPWGRTVVAVVGFTALVGAGVTTAVLLTRSPTDPTMVGCRQSLEPDARVIVVSPEPGVTAVDTCAQFWNDGTFSVGGTPLLAACLNDDGNVEVVPGVQEACTMIGYGVANTEPNSVQSLVEQLGSELSDTFTESCFEPAEAAAAATDIVTKLGLVDWTVDSSGADAGRCNHPATDVRNKAITFSPL
jgi:hypothetical protein